MAINLGRLGALSPVDGRYGHQTESLQPFFSEFALMHYRAKVEVAYWLALSKLPLPPFQQLPPNLDAHLMALVKDFSEADALRIKALEQETNHDVKALEYWLKERMAPLVPPACLEFVHFGLTSQDVNNTAIPLALKDYAEGLLWPALDRLMARLEALSVDWEEVPMLARTHGQPASPTRLGKEVLVFVERLRGQLALWKAIPYRAKFGGATGNFNAHHVAFPEVDWVAFSNEFVHKLGLERTAVTTQIEPYDMLAAWLDAHRRVNNILLDLCRDVWQYISMEYFLQKTKAGEVGSSAMPHKVNPIDFENAEGNLGLANALLNFLSDKLPISRLQRDLTDSTVLRNLGMPLAHAWISFRSIMRGLDKLVLNEVAIHRDLAEQWVVVAEGIQTRLRALGYPQPYEALKELTRGKGKLEQADFQRFIDGLDVPEEVKLELKNITPFNYTGIGKLL